ncbi:hypothetical protein SAMIE_1005090 [Sphingobium amiense]|uniref:Uncharacterized protein n=1 Tax=Sphingobium amiense TaxID=135719 RepID=A0A494W1D4_9SPHN|nr:hypothetical protein [Sphingobium amiense]BBD97008.1 hypothetical protein SAMIE_1005090 [Sphingobium amiense]
MFLDGDTCFVAPAAKCRAPQISAEFTGLFNALERQVIALGQHDDRFSIMPREGWFWTVSSLFTKPAPGLANARLEALRRLVVSLRFAPAEAMGETLAKAAEAGLSPEQISAIIVLMDAARPDRYRWVPAWIRGAGTSSRVRKTLAAELCDSCRRLPEADNIRL